MSQEASQASGSGVVDPSSDDDLEYVDKYCELNPIDHSQGYALKIQSLLCAGSYKEAFRFLEHSSTLYPEMKEVLTSTYLTCGGHCFNLSEAIIGPATGRPDGDFIGPVEIRMTSNGCGRGLFATQNIQRGQVVLISKALALSHEPTKNRNALLQIVKDALNACGEKTRQIFLSHRMKDLSRFIPKMSDFVSETAGGYQSDWTGVCQNFDELAEMVKDHQILDILELIAFDDSSPVAMKENSKEPVIFDDVPARMYYGVWLLPSFVNHSCAPNAARINVGDILRIHATEPIDAGQEITIPYFNVLVPFPSRHKSCSNFGFTCVCRRCEMELNKMDSARELKNLYSDYARISMSEIENRASQLQRLVSQVENCVKYFHDAEIVSEEEEMFERWYRASFTPVYLAALTNRKRKAVDKFCEINETNFEDIANGMLETCPGSLHCLVFLQGYRRMWRDLVVEQEKRISRGRKGLYEDFATYAEECIVEACPSIYGSPHIQQVIDNILEQPI